MLKKGCQAQAHLVFSCLAHVTVSKLIMWQAFCHIDERVVRQRGPGKGLPCFITFAGDIWHLVGSY